MKNKIILDKNKLRRFLTSLKKRNKRIVFTNGCFDLLHLGHIRYLSKAKKMGDCLLVALNTDKSVRKIKGKDRPLTSQGERLQIIASLEVVDIVTLFSQATPLKLIDFLRPDVVVKGADWKLENIVGGKLVKGYGGKVRRIRYLRGHSTTSLIEKIKKIRQK